MDKNLEYYLGLPYTREVIPDPTGGWFIRIKELPGCMSQGETPGEAMRMIEDAMRLWVKVSLQDGDSIPEPRPEEEYSGKFVARLPKSLHRKLVERADQEGVSLNQYVSTALAAAVGEMQARQPDHGLPGISRGDQILLKSATTGKYFLATEASKVEEALSEYMPVNKSDSGEAAEPKYKKPRRPVIKP